MNQSPNISASPTRVRRIILALSCSVSFVLYLHRYTWGFIKPEVQKEFGWDVVTLGWMDSFFVASYGWGQIPSGVLCDWFGAHAVLGMSICVWSLALGAIALATGTVSMAIARFTFGAAQASGYPALNKVAKNWFPITMRTTAQGWIATFFGRGGGAMSYLLFGTILLGWCQLPWRWAIGIFTLLGLLCAAVFVLLFRNTPEQHPWANEAEALEVVADDPQASLSTHTRMRWSLVLRSGNLWMMFFRGFLANLADNLFVYWIPLYLLSEKHVDLKAAGWMAAVPLMGGALGGLVSGAAQSYFIRRTGNRRWTRSLIGFSGKLLAALFMWVSLSFGDPVTIVCLFFIVKFFGDSGQPAEWGTVADIGGSNAATVFACINSVGAIAAFIAGPTTGIILRYYSGGDQITAAGWDALFVIISVEYLLAAIAWLLIDCTKPLEDEKS